MYIVVAGGGMVGGRLVRRLLEKRHDVVMVDTNQEICNKLYAETGVVAVNGKENQHGKQILKLGNNRNLRAGYRIKHIYNGKSHLKTRKLPR